MEKSSKSCFIHAAADFLTLQLEILILFSPLC